MLGRWWLSTVDKVEVGYQVVFGVSELGFDFCHDDLTLVQGPIKDSSKKSQCECFHAENHVLSLK
jgi:hypothetical protein